MQNCVIKFCNAPSGIGGWVLQRCQPLGWQTRSVAPGEHPLASPAPEANSPPRLHARKVYSVISNTFLRRTMPSNRSTLPSKTPSGPEKSVGNLRPAWPRLLLTAQLLVPQPLSRTYKCVTRTPLVIDNPVHVCEQPSL